jgi:hypothetical protein
MYGSGRETVDSAISHYVVLSGINRTCSKPLMIAEKMSFISETEVPVYVQVLLEPLWL